MGNNYLCLKKKISILTLHDVPSYGSVLQTFATQEIFRQMGLVSCVLNYKKITSHSIKGRVLEAVKDDSFVKWIAKSVVRFFSILFARKKCLLLLETNILS